MVVRYEHGLPVITMPQPSRKEKCQFTLKPITDTVGDFLSFIQEEDKGVDRIAIYNSGKIVLNFFLEANVLDNHKVVTSRKRGNSIPFRQKRREYLLC